MDAERLPEMPVDCLVYLGHLSGCELRGAFLSELRFLYWLPDLRLYRRWSPRNRNAGLEHFSLVKPSFIECLSEHRAPEMD